MCVNYILIKVLVAYGRILFMKYKYESHHRWNIKVTDDRNVHIDHKCTYIDIICTYTYIKNHMCTCIHIMCTLIHVRVNHWLDVLVVHGMVLHKSFHTFEWVMSHIRTSLIQSCPTYEWVMSHMYITQFCIYNNTTGQR